MKFAAIYARVSTARQEEEQTIKTQLSAINDLIQQRGFHLAETYSDEGWSGDILARPALDRLRQDAKSKRWEVLVVYDPDRLARRYSYQELVLDELREARIEVIFVTVSAPQNSEDRILYGVRGLFAEYERAKISERFRMGKVRKVKEGHLLVSEPLYGYRYIPKQDQIHGYYEINQEEAHVVGMIFMWVDDEKLTLRKVVRRLQECGIKPRRSKRGVWNTSTLSTMLRNRAYIGEAHWGSSYAVIPERPINTEKYRRNRKSSRRMRPEAEWLTIPVPAIIDRQLFERVQKHLKDNFLLSQRNTKNEYLLAGKIYCPCGRRRAGEGPQRGKHLYYRCTDRVLSMPLPPTCRQKGVNARIVDHVVWNGIAAIMVSPDLMKEQIQHWMRSRSVKGTVADVDIEFMRRELAKLKEQEDRYTRAYAGGLFNIEKLQEYMTPLKEKVAAYQEGIAKAEQARQTAFAAPLPSEAEMESFAREAGNLLPNLSFAAKRGIIVNVLDRVVATKEKLQIHGYIPVTNVNVFTNDRHRQGTPRHDLVEPGTSLVPFSFETPVPILPRLARSRNKSG